MTSIHPSSIAFLTDLVAHNDRDWFAANKPRYEAAQANAREFLAGLVNRMNDGDDIEDSRMYRIYRDVRFSNDKSPYNPRLGMSLSRRKPHLRGGYMVDIRPGGTRVAAGFWRPNPRDLALIRSHIDADGAHFRSAVQAPQSVMGPLLGDAVATAPKGYSREHVHIDLLRHKQFLYVRTFGDADTTAPDFMEEVVFSLRVVRPFFDYMSDILSRDVNGEPLYD